METGAIAGVTVQDADKGTLPPSRRHRRPAREELETVADVTDGASG
jgi:hypothetical protein